MLTSGRRQGQYHYATLAAVVEFLALWRHQQGECSTHNVPPSGDESGRVETSTVEEEAHPTSSQTAELTRHEPEAGIQDGVQQEPAHKRPRWGGCHHSHTRLTRSGWWLCGSRGRAQGWFHALPLCDGKTRGRASPTLSRTPPSDEGAAANQCRYGTQVCASHFKLRYHRSQRVWRCLFGNEEEHLRIPR